MSNALATKTTATRPEFSYTALPPSGTTQLRKLGPFSARYRGKGHRRLIVPETTHGPVLRIQHVGSGRRTSDWLYGAQTSLRAMDSLRRGWDGYRAEPPALWARLAAADYMIAVYEAGLSVSRVAPSVMGGVGITMQSGDRRAYVEFYNSKQIFRMLSVDSQPDAEPSVEPVRWGSHGWARSSVLEVRAHLGV